MAFPHVAAGSAIALFFVKDRSVPLLRHVEFILLCLCMYSYSMDLALWLLPRLVPLCRALDDNIKDIRTRPIKCRDHTLVYPYSVPTREKQLKRLQNETFDVLVIGGGCVGSGGRAGCKGPP